MKRNWLNYLPTIFVICIIVSLLAYNVQGNTVQMSWHVSKKCLAIAVNEWCGIAFKRRPPLALPCEHLSLAKSQNLCYDMFVLLRGCIEVVITGADSKS